MKLILPLLVCFIFSVTYWSIEPHQQTHYFSTIGTSMEPLIHEGNIVKCTSQKDYFIGEIVVYNNTWWKGILRGHRIIYKENGLFLMQGDNESEIDAGAHTINDIKCKIVEVIHNG